jgi:hypothetical protein
MSQPSDAPSDPRLDPSFLDHEHLDPATVEAVGKLSEAMETTERARGHLYAFHQLTGTADFQLGDAVDLLHKAGHADLAETVSREIVGRNVLPGRWTFQIVEEYERTYYLPFREVEEKSRELTGGHQHLHEARLKLQRHSEGEPAHEATPDEPATG